MAQVSEFAAGLPAWTGPDGLPRSWQHFAHGMRHLARARNAAVLDGAAAARAAGAVEDDYHRWRDNASEGV